MQYIKANKNFTFKINKINDKLFIVDIYKNIWILKDSFLKSQKFIKCLTFFSKDATINFINSFK